MVWAFVAQLASGNGMKSLFRPVAFCFGETR
jgi:hypothetical protein